MRPSRNNLFDLGDVVSGTLQRVERIYGNFHEIADDGLEVATGMMFVDDSTFVRYGGGLGKRRFDRLAPRLGLIGSVDTEQVVTIVTLNGVVEIRELDVSLEII